MLERAANIAKVAGDSEGGGRAYLTLIEELGKQFSLKELISIYRSAIESLRHCEDSITLKRIVLCGERLIAALSQSEGSADLLERDWNGFSFKREVKKFEHGLIERALRDASGSVTRAAYLLGFKHHQSLISLLGGRHKALETNRTTVRKRRRRIVSRDEKTISTDAQRSRVAEISVLHVEDNEKVARTVADFLQQEGMHVDSCSNGTTALKILKGKSYYDAIILDNGLPGLNGLELTKRVRKIAHRRLTPIVMFSADDLEREAWRAGVDEFFKPEALNKITSTISRLVKNRDGNNE